MTKLFGLLLSALLAGCSTVSVPVSNNGHTAHLTLNVNEDVKRGTVLVLNGCDGPQGQHYRNWASYIADLGYNTIIVDSFSSRGYSSICGTNKTARYSFDAVSDVQSAGTWVKQQQWSNGKIVVIGFSVGGLTALLANTVNDRPVFNGAISYYPNCIFIKDNAPVPVPIQVHIGTADEWAPVSQCQDLAQSKNFSKVEFYFYQNAHHMFDGHLTGAARCYFGATCRYEPNGDAANRSKERVKKFLKENLT